MRTKIVRYNHLINAYVIYFFRAQKINEQR